MFATLQKSKADQITEEISLAVTENLLGSLISELCYCRNLFDENAFKTRNFGKAKFHALVKEKDEEVDKLLRWLEEGAFDALRKQYLAMIVLGIYTNEKDPSKFVEAWYFRVNSGGGIDVERESSSQQKNRYLVGTTKPEVKELTSNFVRTVVALQGALDPLPGERFVTMRLYYGENVPEEYHPPGFCSTESSGIIETSIRYPKQPVSLALGQSATPYHGLMLRVKTTAVEEETESNQNEETYYETDADMDEMWRESDESDDERSEADSEVNPGHEDLPNIEPLANTHLQKSLVLISSKAPHEKVSQRELREVLGCCYTSVRPVVQELIELGVLRRDGQLFKICPQTALQVLEDRYEQGPPMTQIQRSPPPQSSANSTIAMPTPEYPSPKPFGMTARVYGSRGPVLEPTNNAKAEDSEDSQNPDADMAGLASGFNNAVSLADNPGRLVQKRRPRKYGAASRPTNSLAAVRERSIGVAPTTLSKCKGGRRSGTRSRTR